VPRPEAIPEDVSSDKTNTAPETKALTPIDSPDYVNGVAGCYYKWRVKINGSFEHIVVSNANGPGLLHDASIP